MRPRVPPILRRSLTVALAGGSAVLAAALSGACDRQEQKPAAHAPAPRQTPQPPPRIRSQGEKIYDIYCAGCHGPGGHGSPNLATEPWHNVELDGSPEEVLRVIERISEYEPGSSMPAYGELLTQEELEAVAKYVLSLRQDSEGHATEHTEPD